MRFIKRYNNVVDREFCEKTIEIFEKCTDLGLGYYRNEPQRTIDHQQEFSSPLVKAHYAKPEDMAKNNVPNEIDLRQEWISKMFFECIQGKVEQYITDQHIGNVPVWYFRNMLVQKSDHTDCGGYHQFHSEQCSNPNSDRWLTYMLYLNDIPEGEGETEFLYQGHREQPKAGDLLIWPAGFTHTHRGNPVTTTSKYIATGWVFFGNR